MQDDKLIQIVHATICLKKNKAQMNILFINKLKIPCLLNGQIGPPPPKTSCWLLNLN